MNNQKSAMIQNLKMRWILRSETARQNRQKTELFEQLSRAEVARKSTAPAAVKKSLPG